MGLVLLLIVSAVAVVVEGVDCPADMEIIKIVNDYGGEIKGTIKYTSDGSLEDFGLILFDAESRRIHEITITQLFHITEVTATVVENGISQTCLPITNPGGGWSRNFAIVHNEGSCAVEVVVEDVECPANTAIVKIRNNYGGEIDGTIQYTIAESGSPDGLILYDTGSRQILEIPITQLFYITRVTASVLTTDGKTRTCLPISNPFWGLARNFAIVDDGAGCAVKPLPRPGPK